MRKTLLFAAFMGMTLMACTDKNQTKKEENMTTLQLTQEWDKKFPKSDKVEHRKVTFHNRYGIELAADMYWPKVDELTSKQVDKLDDETNNSSIRQLVHSSNKFPAIAVSGPFGAVKEQSSGLYAQHMAERGFLTIAFDPSFTGESGGEPRRMASPDINTEDFLAAVDFLSNLDNVDAERIGIIGICGFGGMAVNAAAIDPRIKATVAATMYDMSKVNVEGYFKSEDTQAQRMEKRRAIAAQRTEDYRTGNYKRAGGVIDPLPEDAPWFVKDYHAYYKTKRGYHERSGNSTDGWNVIGCQSFLNQPLLAWAHEIENPVLLIHGEKAHSRYFSEYAFERMTGKHVEGQSAKEGNKELYIIPGASHVDLYDDEAGVVPYDKMEEFFKENLK
ncbi:MAG: alpha/beta hydrolase [Prevotella sp.]|nr:alpha/beta hydrolase [Prevotella sp.]